MFESIKKIFGKSEEKAEEAKQEANQLVKNAEDINFEGFHPMIKRVAFIMQQKLNMRLDRYPKSSDGTDHWVGSKSLKYLVQHFNREIGEFNEEYVKMYKDVTNEKEISNLQELVYEAADVCNLMGMVLDKLNHVLNLKDVKAIKQEWEKDPDWKPENV